MIVPSASMPYAPPIQASACSNSSSTTLMIPKGCAQLAGMYHIYDPERFAHGHKHVLWRGMYGNDREAGLTEFVGRLPTLAPALADFVRLIRFHRAPLTCYTRLRRRIEAALAFHLYGQPNLVGPFQDAGIRYEPRRPGEEVTEVICGSSAVLLGLPVCLEA